jgi:hypothetical protein
MLNFFKMNLFKAALNQSSSPLSPNRIRRPWWSRRCIRWPPQDKERARAKARPPWAKSVMKRSQLSQRTTRMTWPLLIDEEPGLRQTNWAFKAIMEDMPPAEETTRPDPDSTNEGVQAETTPTGTTNSATFASCKGIGKRNVKKDQVKQALPRCPRTNILAENMFHGRKLRKQIRQCH